jgi:hypothetical protein
MALRANARVPGGTQAGLLLGITAAALMIFASLLGARRRLLALPVGAMTGWRRAHVWLGGLAFVLALLHAGPRVGGPLGVALLVVLGLVSASGVVGVWIQAAIPRAIEEIAGDEHTARTRLAPSMDKWLHGWLLVHIPLSIAMLVLLAVHALAAFRY